MGVAETGVFARGSLSPWERPPRPSGVLCSFEPRNWSAGLRPSAITKQRRWFVPGRRPALRSMARAKGNQPLKRRMALHIQKIPGFLLLLYHHHLNGLRVDCEFLAGGRWGNALHVPGRDNFAQGLRQSPMFKAVFAQ